MIHFNFIFGMYKQWDTSRNLYFAHDESSVIGEQTAQCSSKDVTNEPKISTHYS